MNRSACFVLNNVGEYQASRLNNCGEALRIMQDFATVIQASETSTFYLHKQRKSNHLLKTVKHVLLGKNSQWKTAVALWRALDEVRPSHIFTIGYSDLLALISVTYALLHRTPVFFMADSKADDQTRARWVERVKALFLLGFSGALVAGARHRAYFRSLGVKGPIELGYDVVDNGFFRVRAARLRRRAPLLRRRMLLPERYVLCVSRLVQRKRLDRVLEIFAGSGLAKDGVRLMVIGAGPLEKAMWEQARELGVNDALCHHRNVRNTLMPLFYDHALALILASDYDQWGLCVNEAQALGLPCIVTPRCGVAGEIVLPGKNGYVFGPDEQTLAAEALRAIVVTPGLRASLSDACVRLMQEWDLPLFTRGVISLMERN